MRAHNPAERDRWFKSTLRNQKINDLQELSLSAFLFCPCFQSRDVCRQCQLIGLLKSGGSTSTIIQCQTHGWWFSPRVRTKTRSTSSAAHPFRKAVQSQFISKLQIGRHPIHSGFEVSRIYPQTKHRVYPLTRKNQEFTRQLV